MQKTVDVILEGRLLHSYPVLHRGFDTDRTHAPATDRDFINLAREAALEDKLLTAETVEKAHFVLRS
jgi:hypothetical protein